ncbi:MAG: hypothetical protein IJK84_05480 [Bacteroidales bacterium]|nr:hypothetical protein [Bacteroidales bacterium]
MKKIILTAMVVMAFGWANESKAQDCRSIVRPMYILEGMDSTTYPVEKEEIYCIISHNAFFITQEVPEGAIVNDIGDLTDLITGQKLPKDYVADLNTISYYRYNFDKFRGKDFKQTVYFRMGKKGDIKYLGVRSYPEAMARWSNPEQFKD